MGTIVVGYVPKPEGDAALARAIEEAKLRGDKLVVVNSHRGGREYADEQAVKDDEHMEGVKQRLAEFLEGGEIGGFDIVDRLAGGDQFGDLRDVGLARERTRHSRGHEACSLSNATRSAA